VSEVVVCGRRVERVVDGKYYSLQHQNWRGWIKLCGRKVEVTKNSIDNFWHATADHVPDSWSATLRPVSKKIAIEDADVGDVVEQYTGEIRYRVTEHQENSTVLEYLTPEAHDDRPEDYEYYGESAALHGTTFLLVEQYND